MIILNFKPGSEGFEATFIATAPCSSRFDVVRDGRMRVNSIVAVRQSYRSHRFFSVQFGYHTGIPITLMTPKERVRRHCRSFEVGDYIRGRLSAAVLRGESVSSSPSILLVDRVIHGINAYLLGNITKIGWEIPGSIPKPSIDQAVFWVTEQMSEMELVGLVE